MLSETISLSRLQSLDNPVVEATKDVYVNEYDDSSCFLEQVRQIYELDAAQDVRFYFEKPKHDPDDPAIYQPIAAEAVIRSLQSYWKENNNPLRLFSLHEYVKVPLFCTLGAVLVTAAAAAPAPAAGDSGPPPEPAAQPHAKKSKGKQPEKLFMQTFRSLVRENCIRGRDGTYFLTTDIVPQGQCNASALSLL